MGIRFFWDSGFWGEGAGFMIRSTLRLFGHTLIRVNAVLYALFLKINSV